MQVLPIVEDLDEGEHVAAGLVARGVLSLVDGFGLEGFEEALHWRIVEAVAVAAHRAAGADPSEHLAVGGGRIRHHKTKISSRRTINRMGDMADRMFVVT